MKKLWERGKHGGIFSARCNVILGAPARQIFGFINIEFLEMNSVGEIEVNYLIALYAKRNKQGAHKKSQKSFLATS